MTADMEARLNKLNRQVNGENGTPGITHQIQDLIVAIELLHDTVQQQNRSINQCSVAVFGDPTLQLPSLKESITTIQEVVSNIDDERNKIKWVIRLVVGLGLGNVMLILQHLGNILQ